MMRRYKLVAAFVLILAATAGTIKLVAYATGGHAWGTTRVVYYVNPDNVYVPAADAVAAIQRGASAWNTQGNVNVQLVYGGTTTGGSLSLDHVNNVFFRNDSSAYIAETYWWYDGTGHIVDFDTVFHENYKFYTGNTGCNGDGYYIENTGTHEMGHALGMAHSSVSTATMWAYSDTCATWKEDLDPDDIAGVQTLYPPATNTGPAAPSSLAAAQDSANPTSSLDLGWTDSASNADGYRIERSTDGVTFGTIAQLASNASWYTDGGLAAGTIYYYRVYAFNSVGNSAYSNVAQGQTQVVNIAPLPAPPPPTTVSAPSSPSGPTPNNGATGINTNGNVTLSWSCAGATSYDVYFAAGATPTLYRSGLTSPSVSVSSLAASTTYSWVVVANNSAGSTTGPTWSFTTKASPGNKKK